MKILSKLFLLIFILFCSCCESADDSFDNWQDPSDPWPEPDPREFTLIDDLFILVTFDVIPVTINVVDEQGQRFELSEEIDGLFVGDVITYPGQKLTIETSDGSSFSVHAPMATTDHLVKFEVELQCLPSD